MTARTKQELYDRFANEGSTLHNQSELEQNFEDLIDSLGSVGITVAASDATDSSKGKADYVCDGTADDVEIQAAIDALPSVGGRVLLSEGTFTTAAKIVMINQTTLIGAGSEATTIYLATGSNCNVFENTDRTGNTDIHMRIADLTIDGNKANQSSGDVISFIGDVRTFIIGVDIDDAYARGIYKQDGWGLHLENVHVYNCGSEGIYVKDNNPYAVVDTCVSESNGSFDILMEGGTAHRVYNCYTEVGDGIKLSGASRTVVLNNYVRSGAIDGILSSGGGDNTIADNVIYDCVGRGIYLSSSGSCRVIGNSINDCGTSNQSFYSNSDNCIISNNKIHNPKSSSVGLYSSGDDCIVTDNYVFEDASDLTLGLEIWGARVTITDNRVAGATTRSLGGEPTDYKVDLAEKSTALDLSGAASDVVVFHATMPCLLYGYTILYTEASSADTGKTIEIGRYQSGVALDDDYFDQSTSEVSKALGYSKTFVVGDLTQTTIAVGDTVTVGHQGGKTGTGEVVVILKIAEMMD